MRTIIAFESYNRDPFAWTICLSIPTMIYILLILKHVVASTTTLFYFFLFLIPFNHTRRGTEGFL